MKYAKTVALIAGSVAAAGASAPAFGATVPTAPRMSLTTGVDELTATVPRIPDRAVNPLVEAASGAAETVREDSLLSRSADTLGGLADSAGTLLGGLPVGG
ncbi:hypothetical protein AB0D35_25240 [Streptomyces sp. NPDC048301]|uniref:hypothetical protein n=1 Tax=unclassified Streptomyces TaxID=2593676 RepID=UPI00342A0D2C